LLLHACYYYVYAVLPLGRVVLACQAVLMVSWFS